MLAAQEPAFPRTTNLIHPNQQNAQKYSSSRHGPFAQHPDPISSQNNAQLLTPNARATTTKHTNESKTHTFTSATVKQQQKMEKRTFLLKKKKTRQNRKFGSISRFPCCRGVREASGGGSRHPNPQPKKKKKGQSKEQPNIRLHRFQPRHPVEGFNGFHSQAVQLSPKIQNNTHTHTPEDETGGRREGAKTKVEKNTPPSLDRTQKLRQITAGTGVSGFG